MSTSVQTVLDSLNALTATEQHELVIEIIRRVKSQDDLSENALDGLADELFCAMDQAEANNAKR